MLLVKRSTCWPKIVRPFDRHPALWLVTKQENCVSLREFYCYLILILRDVQVVRQWLCSWLCAWARWIYFIGYWWLCDTGSSQTSPNQCTKVDVAQSSLTARRCKMRYQWDRVISLSTTGQLTQWYDQKASANVQKEVHVVNWTIWDSGNGCYRPKDKIALLKSRIQIIEKTLQHGEHVSPPSSSAWVKAPLLCI